MGRERWESQISEMLKGMTSLIDSYRYRNIYFLLQSISSPGTGSLLIYNGAHICLTHSIHSCISCPQGQKFWSLNSGPSPSGRCILHWASCSFAHCSGVSVLCSKAWMCFNSSAKTSLTSLREATWQEEAMKGWTGEETQDTSPYLLSASRLPLEQECKFRKWWAGHFQLPATKSTIKGYY